MYDLVEFSESNQTETNPVSLEFTPASNLRLRLSGAETLLSGALKRITDFVFSTESDTDDIVTENIHIWHPSKLDKIVDFDAVMQALLNETHFIDN